MENDIKNINLVSDKNIKRQQDTLTANNKLTGYESELVKQLKAIKEAKEQGICHKCKEDVVVDVNGVCANCGGE